MRLHSNVLVSAYRIGLRFGAAPSAPSVSPSKFPSAFPSSPPGAFEAAPRPAPGSRDSGRAEEPRRDVDPASGVVPLAEERELAADGSVPPADSTELDVAPRGDDNESGVVLVADAAPAYDDHVPSELDVLSAEEPASGIVSVVPVADGVHHAQDVQSVQSASDFAPAPARGHDSIQDLSSGGERGDEADVESAVDYEMADDFSPDDLPEDESPGVDSGAVFDLTPELEVGDPLDLVQELSSDSLIDDDSSDLLAAVDAANDLPLLEEPTSGIVLTGSVAIESVTPPAPARSPSQVDDEERPSTPVARISISRMSAVSVASVMTQRDFVISVSPQLLGTTTEAFVTLSLADGKVVHEGPTDAEGRLEITVSLPRDEVEVRALLECGSKYRNARIKVAESGATEHMFR